MPAERTIRITTAQAATGTSVRINLASKRYIVVRVPPVKDGHVLRVSTSQGLMIVRVHVMSEQERKKGALTWGLIFAVGFAILGFVLIGVGNSGMHSTATPTCNSQTMQPTDVCDIYSSNGDGGSFDYQQMISRNQAGARDAFVTGIVLVMIGALILVLTLRAVGRIQTSTEAGGRPATR
jgi:hypothetical protein